MGHLADYCQRRNCNPALDQLLQQGEGAAGNAGRSADQHDARQSRGRPRRTQALAPCPPTLPHSRSSRRRLGNLGLVNGQSGNDGYTHCPAADQMVSTIATFDKVENDLAGILATASAEAASLGITGDIDLLETVNQRLARSPPPKTSCLAATPTGLIQSMGHAPAVDDRLLHRRPEFHERRTNELRRDRPSFSPRRCHLGVDQRGAGVHYSLEPDRAVLGRRHFHRRRSPVWAKHRLLDQSALQSAFNAAVTAEQEAEVGGYTECPRPAQGALAEFNNDLAGQGVCETIKLQIDQTATLTRSAFTGTLTISNSEGTGAITNVTMDINITDNAGNPANGEFYLSSPTYSGAFEHRRRRRDATRLQ